MADKKISALTAATTPLAGTEVLPIVQSGTTVKVSIDNITAGRTPTMNGANVRSANAIRFYRGDNAIYSEIYNTTGGSGGCVLNNQNSDGFSFQNGGVTQVRINDVGNVVISTAGKGIDFSANGGDVLSQYDEGTWTPNQGAGLTVVGSFSSSGKYTRIGRQVTVTGVLTGSTSVACNSAGTMCSNLPFASSSDSAGTYFNNALSSGGVVDAVSNLVLSVGVIAATPSIYFTVTYFV